MCFIEVGGRGCFEDDATPNAPISLEFDWPKNSQFTIEQPVVPWYVASTSSELLGEERLVENFAAEAGNECSEGVFCIEREEKVRMS